MRAEHRSGCPINLSLEVFGDGESHRARPHLRASGRLGTQGPSVAERLQAAYEKALRAP